MIRAALLAGLVGLIGCGEVKSDAASSDDPKIMALDPDHGPAIGGATITINGTGLSGTDPTVVVDGVAATDVMVTSDSAITFTLPPGNAGHLVDVEVATAHGFAAATAAFRYNLIPVILSISPSSGRFAGGTAVTITGRGFQVDEADVPVVTIGGSPATAVQIIDDKTITATTAAADATEIAFVPNDINISNKNGVAQLSNSFSLTKQGIILVSGQSQQIAYLDPVTKGSVAFGQTSFKASTCALAPNGKLSVFRNAGVRHDLIEYDPIGRTAMLRGQLTDGTITRDFPSMAYVGNTLYAINRQQAKFFSVNDTTGAITLVGATSSARGAIAVKDGSTLWFAKNTLGTLDTISVATGAVTAGITMSGVASNLQFKGLVTVGGVLYASTQASPTQVYTVNTTTGVLTPFASVSISGVTGMCQTPSAF